jgi:hypothetical protein
MHVTKEKNITLFFLQQKVFGQNAQNVTKFTPLNLKTFILNLLYEVGIV